MSRAPVRSSPVRSSPVRSIPVHVLARGGAAATATAKANAASPTRLSLPPRRRLLLLAAGGGLMLLPLLLWLGSSSLWGASVRVSWASLSSSVLGSLASLSAGLRSLLLGAEALGNPGLLLYSLLFSLWVALGLASTPVETAAGLAFGWRRAAPASAAGKLSGALLAFAFGRLFLRSRIESRLRGDRTFRAVRAEIGRRPLAAALLWRFSCLPELAKNFGLAVTPLPWRHFGAATLLHGVPYTLLWSSCGDMARGG